MAGIDICFLGLVELGERIRRRELTAREATTAVLERIGRLQPRLHAYATLTPELALQAADRADREIARGTHRGPLHGVPVAVKDLCHTRGVVTAAGTRIHRDFVPARDATVVTRLAAAGAVPLGKLQLTEGAFSVHHPDIEPPVNPWHQALWPGVSSSGSGVAVAAGLCFGALGTDTLGSIRFPSTMNGVTGLKPTRGRVSRAGVFPLAETLDHVGPMARSAIDAAALLGAIAGPDDDDPTAARDPVPDYLAAIGAGVRGLRIGIDRELIAAGSDADMQRICAQAAAVLAEQGAQLVASSLPPLEPAAADAMQLCAAEAAAAHAATWPARADEYGPALTGLIETGHRVEGLEMARIAARREQFTGRLDALFEGIDLLLVPAMDRAAPTLEQLAQQVTAPTARLARLRFTAPFDLSGHPTLTLPGGVTAEGWPAGFQIVGRRLDEARVLAAGHAFQQATDWHLRRPPG